MSPLAGPALVPETVGVATTPSSHVSTRYGRSEALPSVEVNVTRSVVWVEAYSMSET